MMSPRFRSTAVMFVVALMLTALASSAALAASRIEVGSRVTLSTSDPFHGKVLSRRDACERNRTVAVYVVTPSGDNLYDTTRSNADGAWSIPAGMPHGDFYAVARARSIDKGTTIIVCKRATSPTVTF